MKQVATPRTLMEAIVKFADPEVAHAYVVQIRWPNGVACPHCGVVGNSTFMASVRRWQCKDCRKQFSVKVGTIFEDSPIGLDKWLCAFWMVANCNNGVSSYEIHRALKVTQKTARFMDHRIRLAMQSGSLEKSYGPFEADECDIGGKSENMHRDKRKSGRCVANKAMVMGFLERGGRIHLRVGNTASKQEIEAFILPRVNKSATIYTDSHAGYTDLQSQLNHMFVDHAIEYVRGQVHTNGMENFWSLLKRTIGGTYVSVDPWHLSRYCDEQAFRFNHRKDNDGGRFETALGMITGKRLTYDELTGKGQGVFA